MPDAHVSRSGGAGRAASSEWSSPADISLSDLVELVWRRKAAIAAGIGIGMLISLWASPPVDRGFRSEATVLVDISATGDLTEALQGARLSREALDTYTELATSQLLVRRVVRTTGTTRTAEEIRDAIFARQRPDTLVVEIGAIDADRAVAVQLASEVSHAFVGLVDELAVRNGLEPRSAIIDEATSARRTASHSRQRDVAVGAGLGLLAGGIVALGREARDTRVRGRGDVAASLGACLGTVTSDTDQGMQDIHAAIRLAAGGPVRSIAVVSANPGEGKTSLAVGLARQYASAGTHAVVVDAGLDRKPAGADERTTRQGLSNVLRGQADVRDCIVPMGAGVGLVPSGDDLADVVHLLESERMRNALRLLELEADVVIVDTPALGTTANTYGVSTMVGGVLVAARAGTTHVGDLTEVASRLTSLGAPLLGGVLVPRRLQPLRADSVFGQQLGQEIQHGRG